MMNEHCKHICLPHSPPAQGLLLHTCLTFFKNSKEKKIDFCYFFPSMEPRRPLFSEEKEFIMPTILNELVQNNWKCAALISTQQTYQIHKSTLNVVYWIQFIECRILNVVYWMLLRNLVEKSSKESSKI